MATQATQTATEVATSSSFFTPVIEGCKSCGDATVSIVQRVGVSILAGLTTLFALAKTGVFSLGAFLAAHQLILIPLAIGAGVVFALATGILCCYRSSVEADRAEKDEEIQGLRQQVAAHPAALQEANDEHAAAIQAIADQHAAQMQQLQQAMQKLQTEVDQKGQHVEDLIATLNQRDQAIAGMQEDIAQAKTVQQQFSGLHAQLTQLDAAVKKERADKEAALQAIVKLRGDLNEGHDLHRQLSEGLGLKDEEIAHLKEEVANLQQLLVSQSTLTFSASDSKDEEEEELVTLHAKKKDPHVEDLSHEEPVRFSPVKELVAKTERTLSQQSLARKTTTQK